MLFNVSGLIQDGIGATRSQALEGILETEGRAPEKVSGNVELLRTKSGILVRARLNLEDPELCSRCLKPLQENLSINFEEEFQATVDVQTGKPLDERPDDDAFTIDQNHMLDLTEAVRQYREASADMQPLCREDCKGLCQVCGQDLNTGECRCNAGPIDDRWAGLAGLLPESSASPDGKE